MSSLRERRRRRTEDTIRRSAVDLAADMGLENVTVEMISESAGISTRTFFNYFPYKEAAYLPPKIELTAGNCEAFINGRDDLLADIVALLQPLFLDLGQDRDLVQKTHQLANSNQKLLLLRMSAFHDFEMMIARLIGQRLAHNGQNGDPYLMAALIFASVRRGFENWVSSEPESASACILDSIKDIPTAFAFRKISA